MTLKNTYNWIGLSVIIMLAAGCNFQKEKKLNERISLWRKDKIPYGTYYAFENLSGIFPGAEITINKASPAKYNDFTGAGDKEDSATTSSKKAYIIIAPEVVPEDAELSAMMDFVGAGNHIFIAAFRFGDSLLKRVKISTGYDRRNFDTRDSLKLSVHNPVMYGDSVTCTYPGISGDAYVSSMDSEYTGILGRDAKGRPDFVRFNYKGGGTLCLHFAPLAFSNFFLLHKNNKDYYDRVLSYLPASVKEVKWDDYFRYPGSHTSFSAFRYLFSSPSLRWGFWLLCLLFLCIYIVESKRKQRMVPRITPLRNSSLDFVKTIGRLYFQRRDNGNLASKISAHFMDYARTKYNMPASPADEAFVSRLSFKSGFDQQQLNNIVHTIKIIQENPAISDEALLAFHKQVEEFYKYA